MSKTSKEVKNSKKVKTLTSPVVLITFYMVYTPADDSVDRYGDVLHQCEDSVYSRTYERTLEDLKDSDVLTTLESLFRKEFREEFLAKQVDSIDDYSDMTVLREVCEVSNRVCFNTDIREEVCKF